MVFVTCLALKECYPFLVVLCLTRFMIDSCILYMDSLILGQ